LTQEIIIRWLEEKKYMSRKIELFAIGATFIILLAGIWVYGVVAINTTTKQIRVACVGDSITEGSGYPYKLRLLLGSDYAVGNFGVDGSTVSTNSKKPYMNENKFQEAINFNPNIVVIMLGTNDANCDITPNDLSFEADYTQLVTSFQELAGNQLIFVVKSPPIFDNNSSYNNTFLVNNVLPGVDKIANLLDLPTVEIYDALINHSDYFMDGVHPNSDGSTLIASNVFNAITSQDINLQI